MRNLFRLYFAILAIAFVTACASRVAVWPDDGFTVGVGSQSWQWRCTVLEKGC